MQDVVAGDGTTSVTVICGALLKKCQELLEKGVHPTIISDSFNTAANKACEVRSSATHIQQRKHCRSYSLSHMPRLYAGAGVHRDPSGPGRSRIPHQGSNHVSGLQPLNTKASWMQACKGADAVCKQQMHCNLPLCNAAPCRTISQASERCQQAAARVCTSLPITGCMITGLRMPCCRSLSSKVVSQYSNLLSPMAVDAVLKVMDPQRPKM
jgi:chaperonin GroEL (HSP60 family)